MTTPWILALASLLITVSYGLIRRPRWMWYLGWVIIYFVAGGLGNFWINALLTALDSASVAFAFIFCLGGFIAWLGWVVHWIKIGPTFGQTTESKEED